MMNCVLEWRSMECWCIADVQDRVAFAAPARVFLDAPQDGRSAICRCLGRWARTDAMGPASRPRNRESRASRGPAPALSFGRRSQARAAASPRKRSIGVM